MLFQTKGILAQASAGRLPFPDNFFHAVITSPPYWPHRDYLGESQSTHFPEVVFKPNPWIDYTHRVRDWWGPLGQEPDPLDFLGHLIYIFREIERVTRPDGNVWLNYGDAFTGTGFPVPQSNLMLMPAQLALALQAEGWYLKNDNVWNKTSVTPEPRIGHRWERHRIKVHSADVDYLGKAKERGFVIDGPGNRPGGNVGLSGHRAEWMNCPGCEECEATDGYVLRKGSWRHTRAHEFVFHFTFGPQQFADHTAVLEPAGDGGTRNPRTVWTLSTSSFKSEHSATYPEDLITGPILATVPKRICPRCRAGWAPVLDRTKHPTRDVEAQREASTERSGRTDGFTQGPSGQTDDIKVVGHRPTCGCEVDSSEEAGWVLDPFMGSGTTGIVAKRLGRNYAGVDISLKYLVDITNLRIEKRKPLDHQISGLPMFDPHAD